MTRQEFAEFSASKRLVVWLAARNIVASGDAARAMTALTDELQSLPDENPLPPAHPFFAQQEMIAAELDGLVQEVKFATRRATFGPTIP